ncbi:MAG: SDR family oxidoreductase [Promethearchaeota archaeon]
MKILVTGARGFLAGELARVLTGQHEVILTSRKSDVEVAGRSITPLDLADGGKTKEFVRLVSPDVLVNTAAISLPDWAVDHPDETVAANVTAVENLVEACSGLGAKLVHLSTDYVFSGKSPPYREDDPRDPVNFYGETKARAEEVIEGSEIEWLTCRTTVLYGLRKAHQRPNIFVDAYLKLAAGERVFAPEKHATNPTPVWDLAAALKVLIEKGARGTYHVAGKESVSRYEFARVVAEVFGFDGDLVVAVPLPAKKAVRPLNTTLDVGKLKRDFGIELRGPREALTEIKERYGASLGEVVR